MPLIRSGARTEYWRRLAIAAWLIISIAVSPASGRAQGREARDAPLVFIDLTDDFDRLWRQTKGVPTDRRAIVIRQRFEKILPGLYDAATGDDLIAQALIRYPDRRAQIAKTSAELEEKLKPALSRFETAFGPMRGYPPIYLVNSLGQFDGGTRDLPEGNRLLFGVDVIASQYETTPIGPFFQHELFHLMHHRVFPECGAIWCNLWSEGLAVYVAAQLNPGAADAELLLGSRESLRVAVETSRREAICAVRSRLGSTDEADYAPLFTGGGASISPRLPGRFAYYVGYLVAQDLGKSRNLRELAEMTPEAVRPLLEKSLAGMADCGATPGS